jgi:thiol-disulfide isomerase/thioredoxin
MRKYVCLLLLMPFFATAQQKKTTKPKVVKLTKIAPPIVAFKDFEINGTTDFLDGTNLKMLNGLNGQEEQNTTVKNGKFYFKGTMLSPDFKLIGVNGQGPFVTLFLDNSNVTMILKKASIETAVVKGSSSHDDFVAFNTATAKFQDMFAGRGNYPVTFIDEAAQIIEKFVAANKNAYISPLAIFRHSQATGDYVKQETMYNMLTKPVQESPIGKYIADQIKANASAGYGKPLDDFSQADTSGKMVSLSSFKGKYVLVDFWASWCGPCRAENPNVVRTFEQYKNKNFTVLGISLDRDKAKWLEAITADNLAWTQLSDLKFWSNEVAQKFGIQSIPQNFLLDPQGNLIGKNLRGAALEYKLLSILK